jgi:hypothetical protein
MRDKHGEIWGYQYRPDRPRVNGNGKPVKYETPTRQRNGIDVPPGVGAKLDDNTVPLWITEGAKKADAAACAGLACVALAGVWSWRGKSVNGGKVAVPDWHDIALDDRKVVIAYDSDVVRKSAVRDALNQLAGYLESKGANVRYLHLPETGDGKTGLDDYLAAGHTVEELRTLVRPEPPEIVDGKQAQDPQPQPAVPTPEPRTLTETHKVFQKWLGDGYDKDALRVTVTTNSHQETHLLYIPMWVAPNLVKIQSASAQAAGKAARTTTALFSRPASGQTPREPA